MRQFAFLVGGLFVAGLIFFLGERHGIRQERALTPVFEMEPELETKARKMFADYKEDRIKERINIAIFDKCTTEVAVVGSIGPGVCGFAKTSMPVYQFWMTGEGVQIFEFDRDHLFVIIRDWYKNKLERDRAR